MRAVALVACVALASCGQDQPEARRALEYLNRVRANPASFSAEIGLDLSRVAPRPPLRWDKRLAASARLRAGDLAKRNYFAHVNPEGLGPNHFARQAGYPLPELWPGGRGNNIEALHGGTDASGGPEEAIRSLIRDAGVDPPGHRIQLLGMNDFFAAHRDAGIGLAFEPGSKYQHYMAVHTAQPR